MDLRAHLDWAQAECEFIGELLHKEGMKNILATCLDVGRDHLQELADEFAPQTEVFFRTPRPERAPYVSVLEDDQERHAFLLATFYKARCALFLHECLYQAGVSRWPSDEMGKMLVGFAEAAEKMMEDQPQLFPFSEDNPFGMSPEYFGRS